MAANTLKQYVRHTENYSTILHGRKKLSLSFSFVDKIGIDLRNEKYGGEQSKNKHTDVVNI